MPTAENFTTAPLTELEPWAQEALEQQEQAPEVKTEQAQQDPAASEVVLFQVPSLAAGDAQGLADLIIAHPDLYEQILEAAANFLGNETVTRALDIVHGGGPAQAVEAAQEPAPEATPPDVVAKQAEEVAPAQAEHAPAQEAAPPAQEQEVEPGWVVRARVFNAKHEDDVNLFNIATGYTCTVGGELDPNAVARWQADNGVAPDGRVGKETAERAWALMPVEAPKEQYTLPDDIPPPQ